MSTVMQTILYTRVSTKEQGTSKNGLEAQHAALIAFTTANGIEVLDHVSEVASGSIDERPGLTAALARCAKLKATLLVSKLDRLSRDAAFILDMMKRQVRFATVEDGLDVDPFMLHIKAVFAEHERKRTSERTTAALAALKARGVALGSHAHKDKQGTALKAQAASRITMKKNADDFAQSIVPMIRRLYSDGRTLAQVADDLNSMNVKTARNGIWYASTVCNILTRAKAIDM